MATIDSQALEKLRKLAADQVPAARFVVLYATLDPTHVVTLETVETVQGAEVAADEYGEHCCIVDLASGEWTTRYSNR